ncbi:DUF6233 domain-containing protein [Streptomyces sp. NPDC058655]|uniref:DUF6233 domain-containing protein n=1 Tax=Streptomyces sp. NPDC058655 TaxID=3346577 RepID=UPI003649D7DD
MPRPPHHIGHGLKGLRVHARDCSMGRGKAADAEQVRRMLAQGIEPCPYCSPDNMWPAGPRRRPHTAEPHAVFPSRPSSLSAEGTKIPPVYTSRDRTASSSPSTTAPQ